MSRFILAFAIAAISAAAQSLPSSEAQTLTGKKITFPAAAKGKASVVVFAFSREASDKMQPWMKALNKDGIPTWGAANIEGAPFFVKGMARSSMKKSTPEPQWEHTLILTEDSKAWQQGLHATPTKSPVVAVLSPTGALLWSTQADFDPTAYEQLKAQYAKASK